MPVHTKNEQPRDHLEKNIVYHLSLAMQTVSNVQERLASAAKKHASAEEKQERMETMLSVADDELFGVKEKLQQTKSLLLATNYGSFIKVWMLSAWTINSQWSM